MSNLQSSRRIPIKRKASTQSFSSNLRAKYIGGVVVFVAVLVLGVFIYQRPLQPPVKTNVVKTIPLTIRSSDAEPVDEKPLEKTTPSENFEMENQTSENYRLLLQRDVQKSLIGHFKKPSNYRGQFDCRVRYSGNKLRKLDCGNEVYARAVQLALESAGSDKLSSPLTSDYVLEVKL